MYENEEILGISSLMENDYNHSKINELIKDDCNEEDNLTTNYGTMDYLNFHIPKIIPNEFFCGKLPFGEEYDDPMDIYRAESKEELTFPNFVYDDKFMQLMVKMLKKNPTNTIPNKMDQEIPLFTVEKKQENEHQLRGRKRKSLDPNQLYNTKVILNCHVIMY